MTTVALTNDNWAQIFSYLPTQAKACCANSCQQFRDVLYNPKNDTVLWPARVVKSLGPPDFKMAMVTRALNRQTLGNQNVTPTALPGALEESGVKNFLCYKDLIIACGGKFGQDRCAVNIYNTQLETPVCTATIPPLAGTLHCIHTKLDDWLVRTAIAAVPQAFHFSFRCEVFKLDAATGSANEIFTIDRPYHMTLFEDQTAIPVEPQRSRNRLYFAVLKSPDVEVWELRKIPIHVATIHPPHQVPVSHLYIKDDILVVGHKNTYMQYAISQDLAPIGGGECSKLVNRFAVESAGVTKLKELSTSTTYSLPATYHFIEPEIGIDRNWAVLYDLNCRIFHLQNKTPIVEFARFPSVIDGFILLGWQHFVQGIGNALRVYSLYNLKKNEDGVCVPNAIHVLPEGHKVTTAWFHKGMLIAGDNKGNVWRFMRKARNLCHVPLDVVYKHIFPHLTSVKDLASASLVCRSYSRKIQPVLQVMHFFAHVLERIPQVPPCIWDSDFRTLDRYKQMPQSIWAITSRIEQDKCIRMHPLALEVAESYAQPVERLSLFRALVEAGYEAAFGKSLTEALQHNDAGILHALVRKRFTPAYEPATRVATNIAGVGGDDGVLLFIELVRAGYAPAFEPARTFALQAIPDMFAHELLEALALADPAKTIPAIARFFTQNPENNLLSHLSPKEYPELYQNTLKAALQAIHQEDLSRKRKGFEKLFWLRTYQPALETIRKIATAHAAHEDEQIRSLSTHILEELNA